jgi:hypothetical protein
MPRKEFESFTRLDASDVNTFLMDQSVMTFAGTAARGSAITTPVEGMVTYLEDTDGLELWNGTAWTGVGGGGATNAIINGAFEINQRGLTSSTAGGYGFDRWNTARTGGTTTVSSEAFTLGAAPLAGLESKNFLRTVTSGQSASGDFCILEQPIEGVRSFAGQTVTVSFYAKAASGTPKIGVEAYQFFGDGGSPSSIVSTAATAPVISTSWARYSVTIAVPSISGKTIGTTGNDSLRLTIWFSGGSDFNTRSGSVGIQNNTFDLWGVQLEAGSVATPFRRNANSLQGELAACQRYYQRKTGTALFSLFGFGFANSTTNALIQFPLPVEMRVAPTSIDSSTLRITDLASASAVTSVTLSASSSPSFVQGDFGASGGGLTAQRSYFLSGDNSAAAFVGFSAEL